MRIFRKICVKLFLAVFLRMAFTPLFPVAIFWLWVLLVLLLGALTADLFIHGDHKIPISQP